MSEDRFAEDSQPMIPGAMVATNPGDIVVPNGHLSGGGVSVVVAQQGGMPWIGYWGPTLRDEDVLGAISSSSRPLPNGTLDIEAPISLVVEHGAGFSGSPGISGSRFDGSAWAPRFEAGKAPIRDDGNDRQRLRIEVADTVAELELVIDVELTNNGVLKTRATLTNSGGEPYRLDNLALSLPLGNSATELLDFTGRWCDEFHGRRQHWEAGGVIRENRKGRTSHDAIPVIFAGTSGFGEGHGSVWGMHLGWSGNSRVRAEVLSDGRRYVQIGELLHPGECTLQTNESFRTAWLYGAHSGEGLNAVSTAFHRHVRQRAHFPKIDEPRPVMLNTWEAVYFDHNIDTLKALADAAVEVGVERFVLDDGWFHGRNNDQAGLGDWWVDNDKYHDGLNPVVDHVIGLGLEFGLWVEPEMVNPDSNLYREHPDWALADSRYEPVLGRHQLVLDLARPDAFAYILERLDALLSTYSISYLKWDMNRDHTQATHDLRAGTRKQTHSLYRLLDELRALHPTVEIESCSSGGARTDFEILERTNRIWTSDCNDALERQSIQRGFSMLLPPEVMGAHIGPPVSHTTRRNHDLSFRAATAFLGHLGIEWNLLTCTPEERAELAAFIELHKSMRPLLHGGDVWRLDSDPASLVQGVLSADRTEGVLVYARLNTGRFSSPEPFLLRALDADAMYRVEVLPMPGRSPEFGRMRPHWMESSEPISGSALMSAGLQMPVVDPETALVIHLKAL